DEDFVYVGDLVITEVHLRPDAVPGPDGQWFEILNTGPTDVDLLGWVIWTTDGQATTVGQNLLVVSGERAVIAASADPLVNGGLTNVDWAHGGDLTLAEDGDELALVLGGTEIDWAPIDPSYLDPTTGLSLYLDPDYEDDQSNDTPDAWCLTPSDPAYDIGGFPGDFGTPGTDNPAGLCCADDDGDGMSTCDGDCDDADPTVFPGNPELQDMVDNDCDGLADEDFVTVGSVVISEFMDDPAVAFDSVGEWIELFNNTPFALNLRNWELSDNDSDHLVIDDDVILPPAGVVILAASDEPLFNGNLPSVDWAYSYSDFSLHSANDDAIVLSMSGTEIDRVEYTNDDPWPSLEGQSTYVDLDYQDAAANDEPYVWCSTPAEEVFDFGGGPGDYGTPGDINPPGLCCFDEDGDGYSRCDGDCDETDPTINPGALEACNGIDENCDGELPAVEQDVDGDGVMACDGDCDDTELTVFPGAPELCDGLDNDCDEVLPPFDADGDGDGSPICADCDDDDPLRYPEAHEVCDGIDNDCDEDIPVEELDEDGDGYSTCEGDCDDADPDADPADVDGDGTSSCLGDCDDNDSALNLVDADEDGNTSCDGDCDDHDPLLDALDWDNDGYSTCDGDCNDGAPALNLVDFDEDGYSTCDGDCHDWDVTINPGASELCGDDLDNDCDGAAEDVDADGDGYLDVACGGADCDDADAEIQPEADEVCDGADNDCDGNTDDVDGDGDGYLDVACGGEDCDDDDELVNPAAEEVCDGVDNDCDGEVDPADLCDPGDDDDDDDDDDDCSCDVDGGRSGGSAAILGALFVLIARRRRP
ncbi:MAG: MopE-related protein, partial [Myxococcota bacterium]|nr:MopE-related protein [Myxococcota bacterium]